MKFRASLFLFVLLALSACNFSLAEDITPPPGYVSPTPLPDLGFLYPSEPPSPQRGAEAFLGSCAPCHGEQGLGNGPMAGSLPFAVPAIGLAEISRQAVPADWYRVISIGNLERGMPPFVTHPASERWDILAYTLMLGTAPEEIERGADLFAVHCAECHRPGGTGENVNFTDQEYMSQVSGAALFRSIAKGGGAMPAFEEQFSEEEIWSLVSYLRSLSFDMSPLPTPTSQPTPEPSLTATPGAAETPLPVTEIGETPAAASLEINGSVTLLSGAPMEEGLVAMLIVYDASTNEIFDTLTQEINEDGAFLFPEVPARPEATYWVSVEYQGVTYYSLPADYGAGTSSISLPVAIYETSTDWSLLTQDVLHIALDFSTPGMVQVNELFVLTNAGDQTIVLETDGASLAFIQPPEGALDFTLKPSANSAPFLPASVGIALPPFPTGQYGIIASFFLPYERGAEISQQLLIPVTSVSLFAVEGTTVESAQLTDAGTQQFENAVYQLYQGTNLPVGALTFTVTAPPGAQPVNLEQRTTLIIVAGVLGLVFIILGIVLFFRDRARSEGEEVADEDLDEDDSLGSDPDAITDAIISLDEKFRRGEMSREVYEKRRTALKERLKRAL
jgi:mono/diheme cytochrome c family protein